MIKIVLFAVVVGACFFHNKENNLLVDRVFVKGGTVLYQGVNMPVSSFDMSKYEITNEQYAVFLNAEKVGADGMYREQQLIKADSKDLQIYYSQGQWLSKQGLETYPIVMVNYYGALEYCLWMGGRLPTEAEWYYAAKGGTKSKRYTYSGGNSLAETGWYAGNSQQHAHAVGQKKSNELGIYDMSGNAWEWCMNDTLKSDTDFCVHMGGSWYAGEKAAALTAHYGNTPMHFSNSVGFRVLFPSASVLAGSYLSSQHYHGKPWQNRVQDIPGKIQCEYYDSGGEGITYHDQDSVNNGSGKLNPLNGTLLHAFRMKEGVDISYTKSRDIDNSPFNIVEPAMNQWYVGWTVPGEWINYTVMVHRKGTYTIGLMYTASGDGKIALLLDGKKITGDIKIPSTRNDQEAIAWRQWHHWNRIDQLVTCTLDKGIHILTLQTIANGNMNYDYLHFKLQH